MNTINTQFGYNRISDIFDDDKFYVKIFKDLLNAAITDDFSSLSRTSNEIKNKYNEIHAKVLKFVKDNIYERLYTSDAYDGLMYALVDIYSVMYTIIDLRANITDISIQPDQIIDAYLESFGFQGAELFNYIQKREICKVIYWYLRRKGTPQLIIKILNTLGFSYFFISEFQLCEVNGITSNSYQYSSRLIYEDNNGSSGIGFYSDTSYTYNEVKEYDPLNIKTDLELSNDDLISFPSQSSYYQMGIAVTYPELERKISSFTYAIIKKTYHDQEMGEDVFTSTITDYNKHVSFISLILGYTDIMGEYFGIYDNTLFEKVDVEDYYDEDTFDPDNITTKLYTKDGADYDLESYFGYNFDGSKIEYDEDAYINITPVVGWNKDIYNFTPLEIMKDIDTEISRLFKVLKYQPDIQASVAVSEDDPTVTTEYSNIYIRKKERLEEIKKIFYSAPIFITYENVINKFIEHDKSFKDYIDSILLTKDERNELVNDEIELERHIDNVLELLNNVLEAIEYYIFDNTTYIIPVKNFIISYSKVIEILDKIDRYYAPYHSKLLYPLVTWMIRDLPGDIIALDDSVIGMESNQKILEPYWYADGYEIYDNALPNPYAPMFDWINKSNDNPHIPYSLNYLDEPIYDRWQIQKNNPFLFAVGYDWRYLETEPLIVQSREYKLKYDWEPDKIELNQYTICTSAFDILRPDHNKINLINEINQYLDSKKVYIKAHKEIITIDNNVTSYIITHNFWSKNIFVTVYDVDTGENVKVGVSLPTVNTVLLNFKNVENGKQYKVIICSPTDENQGYNVSGLSYNIINNSYINNYLLYLYNPYLYDCFTGVYDKDLGFTYNMKVRRSTDKKSLYVSHNKYTNGIHDKYRLNLLSIINDEDINKVRLSETLFESYDIYLSNLDDQSKNSNRPTVFTYDQISDEFQIQYDREITYDDYSDEKVIVYDKPYIIFDHKFRTNNLIVKIYDIDNDYNEVFAAIEYLNINQIRIDFSTVVGSGKYKILILATINNLNITALPLNDITGFSASFSLKENVTRYNVKHNLNSFNVFEQIYDKETGELVNVEVNRIDENNIQLVFNQNYVNGNVGRQYSLILFGQTDFNTVEYPSTLYNTKFINYIVKNKFDAPIVLNYDQNSNNFKINYDTNYRTMIYDYALKLKQKENKKNNTSSFSNDYTGGNESVNDLKIKYDLSGGVENTLDSEYLKDLNNGDPSIDKLDKSNIQLQDVDGGDHSTKDENYKYNYDGGAADTLDSEFLKDLNNGDEYIGTIINPDHTSPHIKNQIIYEIEHNLNNKNIVVQIYDEHNLKVESYVQIIDENNIILAVNVPLVFDEVYRINILALPDKSVPLSNYNNGNKMNNFIAMYTETISNKINKVIRDMDSGDNSLIDEDYDNDYDGGAADTLDSEYKLDLNAGDPYIEEKINVNDSNVVNTFVINHNLNTTTLLVNVFNNETKETVNTYVAINDENSITIGFYNDFGEDIYNYCVVVIGALPIKIDMKRYYDIDVNELLQPHHYTEYKRYENDTITKHITYDNDFYDMSEEYITSPLDIKVNIQRYDMPVIKERVDIIHEIKLEDNQIMTIKEDINERYGFNEYSILTNDISSDNNIREDTGYRDTLTHLMEVEPLF